MKKSLLVLLLALLLAILPGCGNVSDDDSKLPESGDPTGSGSDITEDLPEEYKLTKDNISSYRIIIPQNASSTVLKAARDLQTEIFKLFGHFPELRDDFLKEGTDFQEIETEILIGDCNRDASQNNIPVMRTNDYYISLVDKKLVIKGGNDFALAVAVNHLLTTVFVDSPDVIFTADDTMSIAALYETPSLTLNGAAVGNYKIVYPEAEEKLSHAANYLAHIFLSQYDSPVEVVSDAFPESEYEIRIGNVNRSSLSDEVPGDFEFVLSGSKNAISVTAPTYDMYIRGLDALVESAADSGEGEKAILLEGSIKNQCGDTELRSMTFNILYDMAEKERIDLVYKMIEVYSPDTVGFQEVTNEWVKNLTENLCDRYDYVGVSPKESLGASFANPIFYLKDSLELLESGKKWLSATPDVPGSHFELSSDRTFNYAKFRIKGTDKEFIHVNTHMHHKEDELVRVPQVGVLINFLASYVDENTPAIVTGDFNAKKSAESYKLMLTSGFKNSLNVAETAVEGRTYHNFGKKGSVIDHIFVNDKITVEYYVACQDVFPTATYDGYPSDHNPVVIDYKF